VHAERSPVYDKFRAAMTRPASKRGEPSATRAAILRVVEEWERWDEVSQAAFGA
jgi:hypothetical protein